MRRSLDTLLAGLRLFLSQLPFCRYDGMWEECAHSVPAYGLLFAMLVLGAPVFAIGQDGPEGGMVEPSQSAPEMNAQPSAAESAAYSAAMSQPDPQVRLAALRQFLQKYPGSTFRQPVMAQLMAAFRQSRGSGAQPITGTPVPSGIVSPPVSAVVAPSAAAAKNAAPGAVRDSLLQQSPKPAEVKLAENRLAIRADNSALSQILHEISSTTGMKVDGLSKDERIFGSYGPGEPREVLSALLDGSGYNVVMVGDLADGAPRQLTLSQRTDLPAPTVIGAAQPGNEDDADDDQDIQQVPPPEPAQNLPPLRPVTPNGQPADNAQPRTPQQIIQELQRMRQQQDQNQPPPQN